MLEGVLEEERKKVEHGELQVVLEPPQVDAHEQSQELGELLYIAAMGGCVTK